MNITGSFARLSVLLGLGLGLAGGCILTTSEDTATGNGTGGDDDDSDPDSASADDGSTGLVDESGADDNGPDSNDGTDEGTTGPSGDCTENVLDPGFEVGTPSDDWTEASEVFGTPICDLSCTEDEGAAPYEGDWWAWFGGVEEPESASVSQDVTIAAADNIVLSFRFSINASAGTGDDIFRVLVDDAEVFMATDAEMSDFDGYTRVDIDLTAMGDGAVHNIRFESSHAGTGLTSFFVDNVSLLTCDEGGDGSTDGGSDSGSTAADSTDGGSTDTGSTGDGGSSDSGESSGSTGM